MFLGCYTFNKQYLFKTLTLFAWMVYVIIVSLQRKIKVEPQKTIKIMAYTFPTTKDNRRRKVSDVLFRNLPLIQVRNQHSAAVESGNWGMMIYYKFLYHLLEASLPDYPQRVPEHLHKMAFAEPVDALTGLKAILEQDRKYNPDDVERLTKVINTLEEIAEPIPFP